jgi:hypothetical protein
VVALGSTYHEGHFFCAQCGDPFTADTPFVEKEGYAWCVGCHARRFSGKCKRCRQPIIETVVSALGAEWCEGCFCCAVSLDLFSRSFSGRMGYADGSFLCRNVKVHSLMGAIF